MSSVHAINTTRRQFSLPEEDIEFLDGLGLRWETVVEGGVQWLLVQEYPLPIGFNVQSATVAIRIVPGYPAAALDMIYVHPPLSRADNCTIRAVSPTVIAGLSCQQWSRHYTPAHPWRPNIDSVASHLHAADEWFRQALR